MRPGSDTQSLRVVIWVTVCTALAVGLATHLTWGDGTATQILAGVGALVAGLAVALAAVYARPVRPAPARPEQPTAPAPRPAPRDPTPQIPADTAAARASLAGLLERGSDLHRRVGASPVTPEWQRAVEEWIAESTRALEQAAPQFVAYFSGQPLRDGDDPARILARKLERLGTIVHDSL